MKFIPRMIAPQLLRAFRHFGAMILTGPRRSGKAILLRNPRFVASFPCWRADADRF